MTKVLTHYVEYRPASEEEKLAAVHRRLQITALFCCIGWPLFLKGMIFGGGGFSAMFIALLGATIAAGPLLYRVIKNRGIKAAFRTLNDEHHEAVITEAGTVHGKRNKISDHETQSFWISIFLEVLFSFILLFLGCIVTLIYLICLIVRYITLYLKVNDKPGFFKSAFPVMAGGLLVLISAPLILGSIYTIYYL